MDPAAAGRRTSISAAAAARSDAAESGHRSARIDARITVITIVSIGNYIISDGRNITAIGTGAISVFIIIEITISTADLGTDCRPGSAAITGLGIRDRATGRWGADRIGSRSPGFVSTTADISRAAAAAGFWRST